MRTFADKLKSFARGKEAEEELRLAPEGVAEENKGPGKFCRKASPGCWREDLTPEQSKVVEEITAPILEAFYPEA